MTSKKNVKRVKYHCFYREITKTEWVPGIDVFAANTSEAQRLAADQYEDHHYEIKVERSK